MLKEKRIYSKIAPNCLLAVIVYGDAMEGTGRIQHSPENEFLQVASIKGDKGDCFALHRHLSCEKRTKITQEVWVVIEGKVLFRISDLDGSGEEGFGLTQGDCVVTFAGYHGYDMQSDNTKVFEIKSGPYLGKEKDKEYLDGDKGTDPKRKLGEVVHEED